MPYLNLNRSVETEREREEKVLRGPKAAPIGTRSSGPQHRAQLLLLLLLLLLLSLPALISSQTRPFDCYAVNVSSPGNVR